MIEVNPLWQHDQPLFVHLVWHARICPSWTKSSHSISQKWEGHLNYYSRFSEPVSYPHYLRPPPSRSYLLEDYRFTSSILLVLVVISLLCLWDGPIQAPYIREADLLFPMLSETDPHVSYVREAECVFSFLQCKPPLLFIFHEANPYVTKIAPLDLYPRGPDYLLEVPHPSRSWLPRRAIIFPDRPLSFTGTRDDNLIFITPFGTPIMLCNGKPIFIAFFSTCDLVGLSN